MNKKLLIVLLFIFISSFAFSQSWTEDSSITWTVITKENWDRLKLQYEEDYGNGSCGISYVDSLEIGTTKRKVTSGTRPNFNGYYYLLGGGNKLAYGNSNTGRMELHFSGVEYGYRINSDEYIKRYNLFLGRVNGQSASSTQSVSPETSENSFKTASDPNVKGGVVITGFISSEQEVSIPARINNHPVTSIGQDAFFGCSSLASVTIPSSVTSIGAGAFSGCTNLTSITIPNSVTSIGIGAFGGCTSLTSITIPNSVTSIGNLAFSGLPSLTAINVAADNRAYISENGVLYNKNRTILIQYPEGKTSTSFVIPNSVTSIGRYAFSGCTSLTSITIPASVTSIEESDVLGGTMPFSGCTSLTAINVAADNRAYISENGVLYNKNRTILIQYPEGKTSTSFAIPASVTSIRRTAFSGCTSLASVTIPNSVASIGDSAFSYCTSLASVTIPASVTSIGDSAFSGCTSLTSVTFQGTIPSSRLDKDAFGNIVSDGYIGDLRDKYLAGGIGRYTRSGAVWTKR